MTWTDERIQLLTDLQAQHLPTRTIAAKMGTSRNAIIGKLHRLGLSPSGGRITPRPITHKSVVPRPIKSRQVPNYSPLRHQTSQPPAVVYNKSGVEYDKSIPVEQRVTLVQLTDKLCKWPLGEVGTPDFAFCGGTAIEGCPYCRDHTLRAYAAGRDGTYRKVSV